MHYNMSFSDEQTTKQYRPNFAPFTRPPPVKFRGQWAKCVSQVYEFNVGSLQPVIRSFDGRLSVVWQVTARMAVNN